MTPKEIVLSGYEAFAEGNMAKLGALYHFTIPNAE